MRRLQHRPHQHKQTYRPDGDGGIYMRDTVFPLKKRTIHILGGSLLRGTIVNRTYGTHRNLYIYLFSLTIFGPIYYGQNLYIYVYFYSQYLVLFTMVPRNIGTLRCSACRRCRASITQSFRFTLLILLCTITGDHS